ncbi:hypothetical protein, partial [Enterobacter cloacae]|uniref:hypothetical protein n=1 Tax=Enterobacter cloacae TaxID=550 RepID=UPI001EF8EA40
MITLVAAADTTVEVAMTAAGTNLFPGQPIRLRLDSDGPKARDRSGQVISIAPGTSDVANARTQTARLQL